MAGLIRMVYDGLLCLMVAFDVDVDVGYQVSRPSPPPGPYLARYFRAKEILANRT